jgi:hypothetical protein
MKRDPREVVTGLSGRRTRVEGFLIAFVKLGRRGEAHLFLGS